MHVEMPKKGALASMKMFAGEYTMIVVSILTALALEHAVQSWHHSHRAHAAEESINAEMRANLEELRATMHKNQLEIERLEKVRKVLSQDIRDKVEGKQLLEHLMAASDHKFGIHVATPTLRREAWEVAVASQAASWMDPVRLQRYAGVYALQRDNASVDVLKMVDAPSFFNKAADLDFGKVDGTGLYYAAVQIQGSLQSVQGNFASLEKELVNALSKT